MASAGMVEVWKMRGEVPAEVPVEATAGVCVLVTTQLNVAVAEYDGMQKLLLLQ